MKTKCKKTIAILALSSILCISIFSLVGCNKTLNPDDYTLEDHIEFIAQRVQQRYMKEGTPYTSFAVYPLYDENDKYTHFLVEFEPYGFLMIETHKQKISKFEYTSMYRRCDAYLCRDEKFGWQKYRYDIEEQEIIDGIKWEKGKIKFLDKEVYFEVNEQGECVEYYKSPYAVANVLSQKLYFINSSPIIEENGKFIDLVSMRAYAQEQRNEMEVLPCVKFFAGSILML